MKFNRQVVINNFLFTLNFFTLFILLFDDKLIIPIWMQPIGRLHPMLLHFPIVLLLLAGALELFIEKYRNEKFYRHITDTVWITGILSAGITVIMGLFLSREDEFSSQTVTWHKWSGAGLFFISSLYYALRDSRYNKPVFAKAGVAIITMLIIMASHLGATVTHGENFIMEPMMTSADIVVPLEEAIVFDHVIKPVFDKKCITCHNADKSKGELILKDSLSIATGGKSGKLFEPDESLLLKRIHLPEDDKKHMPPSGKSQLTDEEIVLLEQWIKGGTPFTKKVVNLPATDSLRQLASVLLQSREIMEEYAFDEADEAIIEKLNTNYRVIAPVAKGSPALSVNLYNRSAYTVDALEELKEIREQVVSLDLNKLPVTDSDLNVVSQFENLRRLNLNFTEITGNGLKSLIGLKHIKRLNLAGTTISLDDLKRLLVSLESISTIAVWDTGLTSDQLEQLKASYKQLTFLTGYVDDGKNPMKLNTPRIRNKTVVFDDSVALELFHPVRGVQIYYTTNGSEPDSANATLFTDPINIKQTTAIQARAYKMGWEPSDVATLNVYRSGIKPDSVYLLSRLSRVHPANGAQTFFDHQLGSFNANSPAWANNWAGFNNNDMKVMMDYHTPVTISSLALNTLIETETYIFPPESIEIWGGSTRNKLQLIAKVKPEQPTGYKKPYIQLNDFKLKPQTVTHLMIIAKPLSKPPSWHSRKAGKALLLVDEMLVN